MVWCEDTVEHPSSHPPSSQAELRLVPRKHWAHDDDHSGCYACNTPFSIFFRRHHCRFCGLIFCSNCSENAVQGERACNSCVARSKEASPNKERCSSRRIRIKNTQLDGALLAELLFNQDYDDYDGDEEVYETRLATKINFDSSGSFSLSRNASPNEIPISISNSKSTPDLPSKASESKLIIRSASYIKQMDVVPADIRQTGPLKTFWL